MNTYTCGHSKISTVVREYHSYPSSTLVQTVAMLESLTTECNLNISTSPSVYALQGGYYIDILEFLDGKQPHNMSMVRGFAVYLTQQKFNITVNTTVTPTCKPPHDHILNTAFILFVNGVTDSLVTFPLISV